MTSLAVTTTLNSPDQADKIKLGWREWVSLPELGIPCIKAKVDTGARTSALHTFALETFQQSGKLMVSFDIHPLQQREDIVQHCTAEVIDQRWVTDSGGHREQRYVIRTPINIDDREWPIEITLTSRDSMRFRMLLGRTSMAKSFSVIPGASYLTGRPSDKTIEDSYHVMEKKE